LKGNFKATVGALQEVITKQVRLRHLHVCPSRLNKLRQRGYQLSDSAKMKVKLCVAQKNEQVRILQYEPKLLPLQMFPHGKNPTYLYVSDKLDNFVGSLVKHEDRQQWHRRVIIQSKVFHLSIRVKHVDFHDVVPAELATWEEIEKTIATKLLGEWCVRAKANAKSTHFSISISGLSGLNCRKPNTFQQINIVPKYITCFHDGTYLFRWQVKL
jgi:hypothetical protein